MSATTYYKFRSIENWKFILDIIVNSRLYAASFQSLNDPMEGRYFFFGETVAGAFRRAILNSKRQQNICSLSRTKTSTLLWSYYASGHKGIAFGVKLPGRIEGYRVNYDNGVYIGPEAVRQTPDRVARDILTQKQTAWEHEEEIRVFTHDSYVPVVLSELVLGCMIEPADAKLISALARKWHPRIRISKLNRSKLDKPEAV